jgi:hypothetical protein
MKKSPTTGARGSCPPAIVENGTTGSPIRSPSPGTGTPAALHTAVLCYLVGDRVRIVGQQRTGRTGTVSRVPSDALNEKHRYVLLDMGPRERVWKEPLMYVTELAPIEGEPPRLSSPEAARNAPGLLTAFREGLDEAERYSGTRDPASASPDALRRMLDLGRAADEAGNMVGGRLTWSLAVKRALMGSGDLAAFWAGRALAASGLRERGLMLLEHLQKKG